MIISPITCYVYVFSSSGVFLFLDFDFYNLYRLVELIDSRGISNTDRLPE